MKKSEMNINIKKFSSAIMALFPWLTCYKFIISGLTIGDILLILALGLNFIKDIKRGKLDCTIYRRGWIILIIYYVFATSMVMIISIVGDVFSYSLVAKRTIKMGFYFISIAYLIPRYIDYKYFEKVYKYMVYIACSAIIIQYIGYYFLGTYIQFKIPFLSYSNDMVDQFDFIASRLLNFRPDSIFLEPSHFTYFIIGYIIICLVKDNKPKILEAVIISICGLMSKSSAGIFFICTIWIYFLIKTIGNHGIKIRRKIKILTYSFILISVISGIYFSSDLKESLNRLKFSENSIAANDVWSKINIGDEYTEILDGIQQIVGAGLGNYDKGVFTTTINFVYYCTGLIGSLLIVLWIIISFIQSNDVGRLMLICTCMLFFAWYLIYAPLFILYNVIIINNTKLRKSNIQI
ncbi:hypothetical protein P6O24_02180 [Clostridium perfringens]|nr:hypothetical protein [Clostridium perfringens]